MSNYYYISFVPTLVFAIILLMIYFVEVRWIILRIKRRHTRQPVWNRVAGIAMMVNHILAVTGLVCIFYGYFIEPYNFEITTIPLTTSKLKNTSLRIVQISDMHCERKARLEPILADIINPLKPDVIVFTGDAINEPQGLELFRKTLAGLHASIGKYAVFGNWDVKRMTGLDRFSGSGFEVVNQNVEFLEKNGEPFCIAGLGYYQGPYSGPVITKLKPGILTVFLFHTPDFVVWLKGLPIDLFLSGHTHGGQVALPRIGPLVTFGRFGTGLSEYEGITTYNNRGVGLTGNFVPRVRFLCRPEITVFDISPLQKEQ